MQCRRRNLLQDFPHVPHLPAKPQLWEGGRRRRGGQDALPEEELGKLPNPLLTEGWTTL